MVFSSLFFLYAFLPLSLLCYVFCRSLKAKNICLLVFSLIFYTWGEPKYVLLLLAMSFFDWFFALRIQHASPDAAASRKLWVVLSCIVNLGLIGVFKYSKIICSTFGIMPAFVSKIALPLGISFYTFQLLSYVIDVYRGEADAQEEYWHVLLYAALFHQCIAGPIVRYKTIAEELFEFRTPWKDLPDGIVRFSTGLAKKVILANTCGSIADRFLLADAAISDLSALSANLSQLSKTSVAGLWLGLFGYTLQIYFDFSAYSDMAIGMGKMLGLHYLENFNYPYISKSATEFWRRWHISLGTFFRDYVYIPLGGNRHGSLRTLFNTFVVWALTGLWHGANWSFVVWGLYFFVLISVEKAVMTHFSGSSRFTSALARIYFILITMLGWMLFKYTTFSYIPVVFKGLIGANGNALTDFETHSIFTSNLFLLIFCLFAVTPVFKAAGQRFASFAKRSWMVQNVYNAVHYFIIPVSCLLISTAQLVNASFNPFLYFRF